MKVMLAALVSTSASVPAPIAESRPGCEVPDSQVDSLRKAFFFGFPLYEMSRMRQRMLSLPGAEPNKLLHRTSLSDPSDRSITTPNNDTLYSTAWLDLADGPVEFTIPPMALRYHSVELMHGYSDAFAILRNETDDRRKFLIVGPHWDGETMPGLTAVRAPTRDVWLVIRTFVAGPRDLPEAQRLQESFALRMTLRSNEPNLAETRIPLEPDAIQFLSVVNEALARGALPPEHQDRLACFARTGIGSEISVPGSTLDPELRKLWENNIGRFYGEARNAFVNAGNVHNGWRYPASNIANFGTDDVYRSAMALGGLAAMPLHEAINPVATTDGQGQTLEGSSRYQFRIPRDIPVDGFWSLTLYEADGAGRWFLHDNPIGRYAIRSTTAGLRRAPDDNIIVEISNSAPVAETNWLPAPEGEFMLVFRAYRPMPPMLDGTFRLPPVERISR